MHSPLQWLKSLNPLASLTGRIFLWFWLTLIVISAVSFLVLQQWARPYELSPLTRDEEQLLLRQRSEIESYLSRGMTPLQAVRYTGVQYGLDLYLVDPNFRLIGQPRPDQIELYLVGSIVEANEPIAGIWEGVKWIGSVPLTYRGETYRLLIKAPVERAPNTMMSLINERITWTLLALLVSGMLSLLLASSFSRPLKLLRTTSRLLAGGHLEARVPNQVSRRADDIGQLGQDFDHMADRIQKLIEAQQKLLSNISHELRSPLTRLQIALGIARQKSGNEELAPQLDRIEREGQRLEDLIAQLLQLSRLENRLQHMDPQKLDLARILRSIVDDASFEAKARDRSVRLQINHQSKITGDHLLLSSAIENVIRNAINYTEEHSEVLISTQEDRGVIRLSVLDHGPGVPDNDLQHLFDPFFRASNTKKGGSGLGLSITRQAVEAHNGMVRAENWPDGGLQITLHLPIDATPTERPRDAIQQNI
ncbi:ATP-binding protein [Salinispirillum sp. LH 10-3-1]|uniref:histidine kinase n=1 Tax=Salinispirillum sp. LH 10-3-1 TaxID=2952525 RepID=A0AB38YGB0_9GAMM